MGKGGAGEEKRRIREEVWRRLYEAGQWLPPPPFGRIPNFKGADRAARLLASLQEFRKAEVVKVNPDSPQRPFRRLALEEGKRLLMPTPRLRNGFLLLDPSWVKGRESEASTIRGAFRYGRELRSVSDILRYVDRVDFIVEGSVAVDSCGRRLGKGEGYAELEYAIFLELGLIDREILIATSVHRLQLWPSTLPQDPYDVPVDVIATPESVIRVKCRPERPPGIIWGLLSEEKIREIPLLDEMRRARRM